MNMEDPLTTFIKDHWILKTFLLRCICNQSGNICWYNTISRASILYGLRAMIQVKRPYGCQDVWSSSPEELDNLVMDNNISFIIY